MFRAQWSSGNDFLYTADGKIKKRTLGSDKVQTIEFSATIPVNPAKYARKKFDFERLKKDGSITALESQDIFAF